MENKTRKPRKPPVRDPIRKLTRQYQRKIQAVHREIDELAQRGENRRVQTPNYAQEVIVPLAGIIREKLPGIDAVLCEKIERTGAKEAFFKLQAGEQTLGGFSYPGPNKNHIDFTVFAHDKPWGRVFHINREVQLFKVITDLVEFLGLNQGSASDERQ